MARWSRGRTSGWTILLVILLIAAIGLGTWFIVDSCVVKDLKRTQVSGAVWADASDEFGMTTPSGAEFTTEFDIDLTNVTDFNFLFIRASLPEQCFRFNRFYIDCSGENVNEVVIMIGNTVHRFTPGKAKSTIDFRVGDWGANPAVFIFIDSYGTDLADNITDGSKIFTVFEIGFLG